MKKGQVIADGPATRERRARARHERARRVHAVGRLQLRGRDPRVARRLIKDDIFTSIHIEEFELQVRDTKRGVEEITREIPNVSRGGGQEPRRGGHRPHRRARARRRHPGRQGHAQGRDRSSRPRSGCSSAIFGEKAGDVRDASLKAPPGHGRHRHRHQGLLAARRRTRPPRSRRRRRSSSCAATARRSATRIIEVRAAERRASSSTAQIGEQARVSATTGEAAGARGHEVHRGVPGRDRSRRPRRGARRSPRTTRSTSASGAAWSGAQRAIDRDREGAREGDREGHARRRAAARRGQAGQGLRRQEAQALGRRQDGRPPRQQGRGREDPPRGGHAVPPGRNAGRDRAQPARRAVAHEHRPGARDPPRLGGARRSATRCATPVFAGATVDEIKAALREAELPEDGKTELLDGRTGEAFDQRVTVGYIYMLKLSPPGRRQDPRPLDRVRTRSSPSSRWAARRSSAASASAKWKCGRSKPTAPPTRCRSC